ncbi:MAG: hypothetical protein Q7O66_05115, partial [Dehalococcoidia bacterium]|nr:hypothetical protein [Dehalococcoidia bacterium]
IVFGLVSVAVNLPFALLNFAGWRHIYDFHSSRSPDGSSFWVIFGGLPVPVVNGLSLAIVGAGLVVIGVTGIKNRQPIAEQGLGTLVLFMLVNKVSSPQFHLWLIPFLVLLPMPMWLIGLFLVVDLAYYTSSFNALYVTWGGQNAISGFIAADWEPITIIRYLALLLIFYWVAIRPYRFWRKT